VGKLEVQIMIGIMKRIVPKYICLLLTVTSNSCTSMSVKPYNQSAPKTGENYMHYCDATRFEADVKSERHWCTAARAIMLSSVALTTTCHERCLMHMGSTKIRRRILSNEWPAVQSSSAAVFTQYFQLTCRHGNFRGWEALCLDGVLGLTILTLAIPHTRGFPGHTIYSFGHSACSSTQSPSLPHGNHSSYAAPASLSWGAV